MTCLALPPGASPAAAALTCVEIPSDCPGVPTLGLRQRDLPRVPQAATPPALVGLLTDRVVVLEP